MFSTELAGGYFQEFNGQSGMKTSPTKLFNKKSLRMIPLTIKSILDASKERSDDIVEIDGTPIEQCVLVGRVFEIQENQAGKIIFGIDDTTAKIKITLIKKDPQNIQKSLQNLIFQRNAYIRVIVSIRPFKGCKSYISTKIQELKDFNQVVYHMLNCFLSKAQRIKSEISVDDESKYDNSMTGQEIDSKINKKAIVNQEMENLLKYNPAAYVKLEIKRLIDVSPIGMCDPFLLNRALKGKIEEKLLQAYIKKMIVNGELMTTGGDNEKYILLQ